MILQDTIRECDICFRNSEVFDMLKLKFISEYLSVDCKTSENSFVKIVFNQFCFN